MHGTAHLVKGKISFQGARECTACKKGSTNTMHINTMDIDRSMQCASLQCVTEFIWAEDVEPRQGIAFGQGVLDA
eukprot:1159504-Pelagomonas_calceolata.AAC.9